MARPDGLHDPHDNRGYPVMPFGYWLENPCPKCGQVTNSRGVSYCHGGPVCSSMPRPEGGEHLHRGCSHCHYGGLIERCRDAELDPARAILRQAFGATEVGS